MNTHPSDSVNIELLELARKSRGYSQSELARALSVSSGWLSQVEGGLKEINEDRLRRIAELLDYPVDFFYGHGHVLGPGISNMFRRSHSRVPVRAREKTRLPLRYQPAASGYDPEREKKVLADNFLHTPDRPSSPRKSE